MNEGNEIPDSIFWKDFMLINLKLRASSIFKKKPVPEEAELEPEEEEKLRL